MHEREPLAPVLWAFVSEADHENTIRLKAILTDRDWLDDSIDGEGAQSDGWLMIQHADRDPDFQRMMLARLEKYLDTTRLERATSALLWDRVAWKDNRAQRYGSQVTCEAGQLVARGGVEDPANLDMRRAEMGLQPWHEYQVLMTGLNGNCQQ